MSRSDVHVVSFRHSEKPPKGTFGREILDSPGKKSFKVQIQPYQSSRFQIPSQVVQKQRVPLVGQELEAFFLEKKQREEEDRVAEQAKMDSDSDSEDGSI